MKKIFSLYYLYGTIKYPARGAKCCARVRGYYFCVATLTNELGEVGLVTESRLPRPPVTCCTLLTWAPLCHYLVLLKPLARCTMGNQVGIRQTLLLLAKLTSCVEILRLQILIERDLDICKHLSQLISLLEKACGTVRNQEY